MHSLSTFSLAVLTLTLSQGALADDIVYSGPDQPSVFAHPVCLNTFRNGIEIGSEAPATYPLVSPSPAP